MGFDCRDNQNAVAEPQPLVQPRMFPSPPKLAQFKLMPPLPDYIPCSDMWNPYANFPTVHHSFREGQWWVNRSSFEIDKYYRELEESEKVVADARRRGVPLAKVTEESEKGYEGENPESLFKALRNFQNDGDQLLSISWEIVAEASPDKGQVTTILA
ncbi:hypothetical protein V9T40_011705 [Parthenolecanium corni]|uniref:Uncharacterized protein n=1 Tax=Parthenolecanium corni TaxID=536013 RepID=A0AAN9XYT8_9HEMI